MKRLITAVAAVAAIGGGVMWWRRHPRAGAAWVNRVANPWLVRRGVPVLSRGEIGLLEHVGRRSGAVRVTPVHPVPTAEGFRIIVPLGTESQWVRNVLAAGRCRLQVEGEVHELDEPRLFRPAQVTDVPDVVARVLDWLGFRYLALRRFSHGPGTLEGTPAQATIDAVDAVDAVESTPEVVPA